MVPLDNPIWEALVSKQAGFALGSGGGRRFQPEVSLLAGVREPSPEALEPLAPLVPAGETIAVFGVVPIKPSASWKVLVEAPLLQMERAPGPLPPPDRELVELTKADVPEMLALAELTKPGPFGPRTIELGTYLGVKEGGRLAAMAGERLGLPGYTEVSAVCAHPEHAGRGHAKALMAEVCRRMEARGERPFLHSRPENARAIGLYESLGFRRRAVLPLLILRRA